MTELALIAVKLEAVQCPEDVFGANIDGVKNTFRHILRVVHPDFNGGAALAHAVTERLNQLKKVADERVQAGTYGKKLPLLEYETIEIEQYSVRRKPSVGDVADIYTSANHVLKIARSVDDNDLIRAERKTLTVLNKTVTMPVRAGFPTLVRDFQLGKREVNVLEKLPKGFVSVESVRRHTALDLRALIWIFKRILSMLGWVHHCGFVHGGVLPQHVWVYPDNDGTKTNPHPYKHTVRLLGWCSSVEYAQRTRLSTWVPAWKAHYPPELLLKRALVPASDIYMAAALIGYLYGQPLNLPDPLKTVLLRCTEPDLARRYKSVDQVFQVWVQAAEKVYGPPKWVDFNIPGV